VAKECIGVQIINATFAGILKQAAAKSYLQNSRVHFEYAPVGRHAAAFYVFIILKHYKLKHKLSWNLHIIHKTKYDSI